MSREPQAWHLNGWLEMAFLGSGFPQLGQLRLVMFMGSR
jgi:hypothetical protein